MYCFGISVSHSVHHSSLFREKRHRKESTVQEAAAHEPTRRRLNPLFTGLETLSPFSLICQWRKLRDENFTF
jgi:hypothetical protein